MRAYRIVPCLAASLITGGVTFAQVGRGWSDWPTPYADAQRTSWLQSDPNMTVERGHKIGHDVKKRLVNEITALRDVLVHLEPETNRPESPPHDQ